MKNRIFQKIQKILYGLGIESFKDAYCIIFFIKRKFQLEPYVHIDENNNPCETSNRVVRLLSKKTVYISTEILAKRYWSKYLSKKHEIPINWIGYF